MSEAAEGAPVDTSALIELAIDAWKFARLFNRVVSKLDSNEQARYLNQVRFFERRVEQAAESIGAKLVSIEGLQFEAGLAATPLNLDEFSESDTLFVDQMLEPIVMGSTGVLRFGTLMLRKL